MTLLPPDVVVSLALFSDVTHRMWNFTLLIMSVTPGLFCVNKQNSGDGLGCLFCEKCLSIHKELGTF